MRKGVEKWYDAKKWEMVRNGIKRNRLSGKSECDTARKWVFRNGMPKKWEGDKEWDI